MTGRYKPQENGDTCPKAKLKTEHRNLPTMLSSKRTNLSSNPTSGQSSSSSSSAETIGNNDDLLTLILVRLPIISLLKFKSVSKRWLSLISNPDFSSHLIPNPKPISGLFFCLPAFLINPKFDFLNLSSIPIRAPFRSLDFVHDPSGIRILQSSRGLLLCCSFRGTICNRTYYIYNPTTKQHTTLPQFCVPGHPYRRVFGVNLAFDPSKSPHYKVVCIRSSDSLRNHYQMEIYTSETGTWRLWGGPFTTPVKTKFDRGVFCNGAIHWISNGVTSLYFDVDEEQLREMPMPDERRIGYFGESRDHLHLIEFYEDTKFNVYEMARDYSGWLVRYRVDLDGVVAAFPEIVRSYLGPWNLHYYAFSIRCFVKEESDEDSFLVLRIAWKIIRYDLKDMSFKILSDFAPGPADVVDAGTALDLVSSDVYQYIESLARV